MTITAIPKFKPDWYTPEDQRDDDNPTQFQIQPLDSEQLNEVLLHYNTDSETITGKGMNLAVQYGLRDWKNFPDPDTGRDLKFSRFNIKRIPNHILLELGGEIIGRSQLSEDEEKNS